MSGGTFGISDEMLKRLPLQVSHVAQWLLLFVGVATTSLSVASAWSNGGQVLNNFLIGQVTILGAVFNLVLILLVLFPGRIRPLNHEMRDPTVRHLAQSINAFSLPALTWFWRFLGLLYVVELFRNVNTGVIRVPLDVGGFHGAIPWPDALSEYFSVGSTFFIFLAYIFLTPEFLRRQLAIANRAADDSDLSSVWLWRRSPWVWQAVALFLTLGLSAALFALLGFEKDPDDLGRGLVLLNGVVAAIAFGCFVGRMDSKFVSNWQWAIPLLFCYAGVQVYSTVVYEESQVARAVFTYFAFTMKCVLYIFLSSFFETRRVLYYADEIIASGERNV